MLLESCHEKRNPIRWWKCWDCDWVIRTRRESAISFERLCQRMKMRSFNSPIENICVLVKAMTTTSRRLPLSCWPWLCDTFSNWENCLSWCQRIPAISPKKWKKSVNRSVRNVMTTSSPRLSGIFRVHTFTIVFDDVFYICFHAVFRS